MALGSKLSYAVKAAAAFLLLMTARSYGQDVRQDHSCTVDAAGSWVIPKGQDGRNFERGWGLRGGGGFAAFWHVPNSRGPSFFFTLNYMYAHLQARPSALKVANATQSTPAASANGSFSAVTFDPTFRYLFIPRVSIYGSGGFGYFRRGVVLQDVNPATLLQSSSASLARQASNSGAFDIGGGMNFGLKKDGGLMLFADLRLYKAAAVNSGTKLLPLSVGIRW
jgi:hypothetical protein